MVRTATSGSTRSRSACARRAASPRSALRGIPAYAGGVVATAVDADGKREVLAPGVGTSEDGAFWLAFLRGLVARGLSGVELVTSDAHQGLRAAIATVFGGASWHGAM